MRLILISLFCLSLFSCQQQETERKEDVVLDKVASSDTYQKYMEAYKDYQSCKQERPQLTQDYMDNKITAEEFRERLKVNGKACNIKRDIYNRYYRLLQAEFDKEAEAYKINEE